MRRTAAGARELAELRPRVGELAELRAVVAQRVGAEPRAARGGLAPPTPKLRARLPGRIEHEEHEYERRPACGGMGSA